MSRQFAGPVLVAVADPPSPRPIWLITFTDLVGLLLAFFVMIFAMSSVDEHRYRELATAADFGRPNLPSASEAAVLDERNAPQSEIELGRDVGYLGALLREQVSREPTLVKTLVRQEGTQIVLSLPAELLFEPNGAQPSRTGARALFALVGLLRNLPNRIEIEGHADPNPPSAGGFASNWELSLARAAAVALRLEKAGYRQLVVARGRAASRFDEIAAGLPAPERQALARRVDVIVYEDAN